MPDEEGRALFFGYSLKSASKDEIYSLKMVNLEIIQLKSLKAMLIFLIALIIAIQSKVSYYYYSQLL